MAQIHAYGNPFQNLNPPDEWQENGLDAVLNDGVVETTMTSNVFTFSGKTAVAILAWKATYGVHNGMPYRITLTEGGLTLIAFNGYLNLRELEYDSTQNPVKLQCPVVQLSDPKTVLDEIAVMTQGALVKNGNLVPGDYIDVPFIIESKKNIRERTLIISQFAFTVVQSMTQIFSNILGAIANLLSLGIAIAVIELGVVILNAWLTIKGLMQQWALIRDLLFPTIRYYKGISVKKLFTKAFGSKGYSVQFGILDDWASNTYLIGSQNENPGLLMQYLPVTGEFKRNDSGYIIGTALENIDIMTNLKTAITGTTVHLKTRSDPYWVTSPVYQANNELIRTVKQQANGFYRDDTDEVKGTVMLNYQYDMSDAHTLTEKNGDSHEVRRKLITELNPKMNLLKKIDNLEIPWAMCVRKKTFDNMAELFEGVTANFNTYLQAVKDKFNAYYTDISNSGPGADALAALQEILDQTGLNAALTHRDGVLKVEDDSWAIPKVLYLKQVYKPSIGYTYRIPENFKDFIGAKPLYNNYYKPFSPADINEFKGQYRLVEGLRTKWSVKTAIQTEGNPYFDLDGKKAHFTFVNYVENGHEATTNIKVQDPFDTNITEIEI